MYVRTVVEGFVLNAAHPLAGARIRSSHIMNFEAENNHNEANCGVPRRITCYTKSCIRRFHEGKNTLLGAWTVDVLVDRYRGAD